MVGRKRILAKVTGLRDWLDKQLAVQKEKAPLAPESQIAVELKTPVGITTGSLSPTEGEPLTNQRPDQGQWQPYSASNET